MIRSSLISLYILFCIAQNPLAGFASIGEDLGVDLYTQIDTAGDVHVNALIKKELANYPTFARFGKDCRKGTNLIDNEPMDQGLLDSVASGDYSPLMRLAGKNGVAVTTESILALGSCLTETYRGVGKRAINDDITLSIVGSVGLYMDGSRENSDYDILTDIEKINTIIFSNPDTYKGVNNAVGKSYKNLLSGNYAALRFERIQSGATDPSEGSGTITDGTGDQSGSTHTREDVALSFLDLGLGASCGADGSINTGSIIQVDNMMDEDFLRELNLVLSGQGNSTASSGKNYTPGSQISTTKTSASGASTGGGGDFFHTMPCDGVFCIRVRMDGGSIKALGSSDSSIESIIEKHSKILNPISHSDLGQQKMTNNTFQLPFINLKIANKIAGLNTYMSTRVQEVKRDKKEETQESKNAELERIEKCANLTAGLTEGSINSPIAYTYMKRGGVNTENIEKTKIPTNPIDLTAEKVAYGCMDSYLVSGRETLNKSFVTDIIQIQAFTMALTNEIQNMLNSTIRLDTLKSK